MDLHLEAEEASLLFRVARNRRDELRSEVRHNRNSESRAYLKHKEKILNRILAKFPELDERAHMRGHLEVSR
jgi:hypothetical protein